MKMSKGALALNGLLAMASVLFAAQIGRVVVAPSPPSGARAGLSPAARGTTTLLADPSAEPRQPLMIYAVIPSKNIFSPARTEGGTVAGPAATGPKPFLYGVVLRDDMSIAYLEDPGSKRVAGYQIGDAIAGGTVQAIANDHIVLKRSDGSVDVQLRDPLKPRPIPAESAASPGQGTPPAAAAGAVARPPAPPAATPGAARPQLAPPDPGAVPALPTLLRRLPPAHHHDAPDR